MRENLAAHRRAIGTDKLDTLVTAENLGNLLLRQDKHSEADKRLCSGTCSSGDRGSWGLNMSAPWAQLPN